MIWYDTIRYDMIWYDIWYDRILYDRILYDIIRYDIIWYYMIRYDTTRCVLIRYGTIRYDILFYVAFSGKSGKHQQYTSRTAHRFLPHHVDLSTRQMYSRCCMIWCSSWCRVGPVYTICMVYLLIGHVSWGGSVVLNYCCTYTDRSCATSHIDWWGAIILTDDLHVDDRW